MTRYFRPRPPRLRETALAAAVAAGVAAATFYLARTLLARDRLGEAPPGSVRSSGGDDDEPDRIR